MKLKYPIVLLGGVLLGLASLVGCSQGAKKQGLLSKGVQNKDLPKGTILAAVNVTQLAGSSTLPANSVYRFDFYCPNVFLNAANTPTQKLWTLTGIEVAPSSTQQYLAVPAWVFDNTQALNTTANKVDCYAILTGIKDDASTPIQGWRTTPTLSTAMGSNQSAINSTFLTAMTGIATVPTSGTTSPAAPNTLPGVMFKLVQTHDSPAAVLTPLATPYPIYTDTGSPVSPYPVTQAIQKITTVGAATSCTQLLPCKYTLSWVYGGGGVEQYTIDQARSTITQFEVSFGNVPVPVSPDLRLQEIAAPITTPFVDYTRMVYRLSGLSGGAQGPAAQMLISQPNFTSDTDGCRWVVLSTAAPAGTTTLQGTAITYPTAGQVAMSAVPTQAELAAILGRNSGLASPANGTFNCSRGAGGAALPAISVSFSWLTGAAQAIWWYGESNPSDCTQSYYNAVTVPPNNSMCYTWGDTSQTVAPQPGSPRSAATASPHQLDWAVILWHKESVGGSASYRVIKIPSMTPHPL